MNKLLACILLGGLVNLQQQTAESRSITHHRTATPYHAQGENTDHEYEVRRRTAIRRDGSVRNIPSCKSSLPGKHRREDSYDNKYQGSDEINLENSEIGNPRKFLVSSHYRRQGLQRPPYRSGFFYARRNSRRENAPSLNTDSSKEKQNSTAPKEIKYKPEGTSFRSWDPIKRRKYLESRFNKTATSSPEYSEGEGKRQDVEREQEKELDQNINFRNEDDEVYDEEHDGVNNVYTREIDNTRKSDDSYKKLQAVYQQEDDGVQSIRNEVPYFARTGTRSYAGDSSYGSSEGEMDDSERTENIHSRIERLKDRTRTLMVKEFGRRP